jgi:HEAT repeat protein
MRPGPVPTASTKPTQGGACPLYEGKTLRAWLFQLQSPDANARQEAASALGKIRSRVSPLSDDWPALEGETLGALTLALKSRDKVVRFTAAEFLGRYGGRAVPAFIEALKDEDARVRADAASGLAQLFAVGHFPRAEPEDAKAVVPVLGEMLLKDKAAEVRQTAGNALWRIGTPAVPALLPALKSEHAAVRKLALGALGRMTPPVRKAVPAMAELLKDEDESVAWQAGQVLGEMGDAAGEALPALLEASKADTGAGRAARDALKRVRKAPQSSVPALVKLLKDPEPSVRLQAVQVLCDLEEGDKECLATLVGLVRRREASIRFGAATLLSKYGSAAREAVPALIEVVRNETDFQTRLAAVNALGCIGPDAKAAVGALKAALPELKTALPGADAKGRPSPSAAFGPDGALDAAIRAALKKIEE